MATENAKPKADERACPFCAETIKSAAVVCRHCKRDLPVDEAKPTPKKLSTPAKTIAAADSTVSSATNSAQKLRTASNQKVWGIILVAFGALSLFTGDFTVGKFLLFIAVPLGVGIWLITKAAKTKAEHSGETGADATAVAAKAVAGVSSKAEDFSKIATEKSKAFFAVKRNVYITVGAAVAILALIIGLGVKSDNDEKALVAEAAAVQAQQDKEKAAQELEDAITVAEQLVTEGNARYDESVAWSNDADREALKQSLTMLSDAVKTKKYDAVVKATTVASDAYKLVGTQAEATARAEAAAKEAAAQAEAARKAAETMGQRNAVAEAKSYLKYQAFSRQGLIGQLEYEGYSTEDSTYGADNAGADWYEQAVKTAASYLKYSSFSSQGLLDQLLYEGFTPEEAQHGVSQNGY